MKDKLPDYCVGYRWEIRKSLIKAVVDRAMGRELTADMLEEILTDISRLDKTRRACEADRAIHATTDNQFFRLLRDAKELLRE